MVGSFQQSEIENQEIHFKEFIYIDLQFNEENKYLNHLAGKI